MDDVCEIFKCAKTSLKRWIDKYEEYQSLQRNNKQSLSYKITKTHVKDAIRLLKQNEQITLDELHKLLSKKFDDFDITSRQLGNVLYDNNITRKRARHKHFPQTRFGKPIVKQEEMDNFYKIINKYDIRSFKEYIKKKIEINNIVNQFYKRYIFRKLKLNSYINRKKSEQRMIQNFEKKFGKSDDVIITIGDFEQKKHMKYKEASKGKGIRTIFKKNNYQVYLVDEFRTSCKCSNCNGGDCNKIMTRPNPRPFRDGSILVHALLRCKNEQCGVWWNRDINGAKNIYKIAECAIKNKDRPNYLKRESHQTLFTKVSNSKLTRYVKTKPCS